MSDAPLTLPPGVRRHVAKRVLLILGLTTAGVGGLVALLSGLGLGGVGVGILVGHLLAHALTASWIVGGLLTFAASQQAFMVATVGAFPVRLLLVLAGVYLAHLLGLHLASLVLSMVVTQVVGHGVEIWTFCALADAAEPPSGQGPA